jgi:acyl transferase domain-containing protein/acyl carrier protein
MSEFGTNSWLERVAIIGMAGRFPGAGNIAQLWRNLCDGVESVTFFSDDELIASGVPAVTLADPNYVKAGTVLEGADLFDAAFFNLSPREAGVLDPQHRIFLECSHHALEDAGYDPQKYDGLIGVYAGSSISSYLSPASLDAKVLAAVGEYQALLGNDKDFVPTRVSYKLNLKGPSVNVQTACSTSLVAVHLACQSLLSGECDLALAGGISLRFPQKAGYHYQDEGILSPDGHCRAFDAKAAGTLGGNGVGIVVLKRLSEAIADGDTIHAVILGSAINNDGALKVGYTAPSVDGQANVIASAQALAGVDAGSITYVETHGTGTLLGDPIEVKALTQAFRDSTTKNGYCAIGSIKTNLGHCDSAAGIAGLIKTVLSLKHRTLVPSLNFEEPNPRIDFANSPFYVNTKRKEWKRTETPLRAGVSSFGIGGTNAHVVLEEAPELEPSRPSREWQLITLSAKTETALDQTTANLANFLRSEQNAPNLADLAYTLQLGRTHFGHRRVVICDNIADASTRLETLDQSYVIDSSAEAMKREIVFMFPGQGAQHTQMGRDLYEQELTFRKEVDGCSELLLPVLGCDLRDLLYPAKGNEEPANQQLMQTAFTQPALFVVEYALGRMWMQWGVRPEYIVGHSIGEYVAACLSEVMSLEDALRLVVARGKLMQSLPGGAMLAVLMPEGRVQPLLSDELTVAVINGPSQCVVSGAVEAVDKLERQLTSSGEECRRLKTSHAFHSSMMDAILEPFIQEVNKVVLSPPSVPFLSNLSGKWITDEQATDPRYWADHLRHTVRFSDNVGELCREPDRLFLEVGPGQTLSSLVKQHPEKTSGHLVFSSMRHPNDEQTDSLFLLNTLGQLWLSGVEIDWNSYYSNERRRRIQLTTYPFERQRFWTEACKDTESTGKSSLSRRQEIKDWFYTPVWKQAVSPQDKPAKDQTDGSWLVFLDERGLGKQLVERLQHENRSVSTVEIGAAFAKRGNHYAINPQRADDYRDLFATLQASDRLPNRILHLWSVSAAQANERIQELGFFSLLLLAQALGNLATIQSFEIDVVSSGLHRIAGEPGVPPEKATLLGAVKVIPQEFENVTCRSVDVTVAETGGWSNRLVDSLLLEFAMPIMNSRVAYRGSDRWVQTFEAVPLGQPGRESRLREGGVYLITGGLGGIALELAEYLAEEFKAKLILVGRSAFPAKQDWAQWLATNDDQNLTTQKIRRLLKFENAGAEVLVASADVADVAAMREVVSRGVERFGKINGVVHAAGLAGGGVIQLKTIASANETLAPKVVGTQVLSSLLADTQLDFFVLCSSLNALLGGSSQADYCAANSFLDAFAQNHRHDSNKRVVAIDWNMWRGTGMADSRALPADLAKLRERMDEFGISAKEGVEVFRRILASGLSQVAVSTQNLFGLLAKRNALESERSEFEAKAKRSKPAHARPKLTNTYVAPGNDVEKTITEIWQELLDIEQIGVHDNFFQLGGHSLLGTRLISRLHDAFQVSVTLRRVFELPTIAGLATAIDEARSEHEEAEKLEVLQLLEQLADDEIETELAKRLRVT